ncbi:GNAT family N-acetyltransferase [Salimicrobium humidisoli]|uniref:GNAT family N-acetyltransferase n=1 Tax=Salimicrobium humidisoli TaxID=2029857 RepID=A0ABX4HSJ3_9BACI|nr:GNAT family N-acetyltransferase [Salimicrobium humidisoli]PBB06033.1 GNAT family N-acetyltransferase [Salimicrobium humidisoli]
MEFRKAAAEDVAEIIPIIQAAQQQFREQNISQWTNGYPDEATIMEDVRRGESYVLTEYGEIVASTVISPREEMTYRTIYEGEWMSREDYLVIHRLAVKNDMKKQGLASLLLKETEKMARNSSIPSVKVDTHEQNVPMQQLLLSHGYVYCGVIYLTEGSKRLAYEKLVQ